MSRQPRREHRALLERVRRGEATRPELDAALANLFDGARTGDPTDGDLLIELLDATPILRSTISGLLFDEASVDDALQETLLAITSSLDSFSGTSGLTSWAAGIARHKALDVIRRKGRPASPDPIDEVPTELHRFTSQWATHADVDRALDQLSPKLRPVFELADLRGFSYDEIAEELGLARNTVASRLRRARAQMQLGLAAPGRS